MASLTARKSAPATSMAPASARAAKKRNRVSLASSTPCRPGHSRARRAGDSPAASGASGRARRSAPTRRRPQQRARHHGTARSAGRPPDTGGRRPAGSERTPRGGSSAPHGVLRPHGRAGHHRPSHAPVPSPAHHRAPRQRTRTGRADRPPRDHAGSRRGTRPPTSVGPVQRPPPRGPTAAPAHVPPASAPARPRDGAPARWPCGLGPGAAQRLANLAAAATARARAPSSRDQSW